jgi:phosphomannomutase / phosphoglucomutase
VGPANNHPRSAGVKPALFGTAGIRGLTNIHITPLLALKIAQVYGDYLGNRGTVALGHDTRYGAQMLVQSTASGLISSGISVLDCGCLPIGGLACMVMQNRLAGGIMITGSHTPYEMIGIIILESDGAYLAHKTAREIESRYYNYDKRQVVIKPEQLGVYSGAVPLQRNTANYNRQYPGKPGLPDYKSAEHPLETYQSFLLGLVNQDIIKAQHYRVLIDPCNGTAGLVLPSLLKSLGCEVVLNNETMCPVPNRPAEPRAVNLGPTALKVKDNKCHLGIATDIDADRVLLIDETGKVLSEDLTGAIFARWVFESHPDKKVCVTPLNSSGLIEKVCKDAGREWVACGIGAPETLRVIKELKASFAYEESGKYYFSDEIMWPDGILAAIKMLQIMAEKKQSLSELASQFPMYYQIKHTVLCPEAQKDKVMQRVRGIWEKEALAGRSKDMTIDGLKRSYDDGSWLLIRKSGTEPLIRVFADSPSAARADELVRLGEDMVKRAQAG